VALSALVVALVVGSHRRRGADLAQQPGWVRLGNAWVELFRNIPLLVQIFLWYHVLPAIFLSLRDGAALRAGGVCAGLLHLGADCRAGARRHPGLPRGQRYAGMAVGFTTFQYYRYVMLPMAVPHHPAAADQRVDEHLQELVGGVCRVDRRADACSPCRRSEETSRGIEMYLGVTGLYVISAFAINRIMPSSRSVRACPASSPQAEPEATDMNLDFGFVNWDVITDFVLKGFYFSVS
jgi:glutamate/aspartate transport system permease protein